MRGRDAVGLLLAAVLLAAAPSAALGGAAGSADWILEVGVLAQGAGLIGDDLSALAGMSAPAAPLRGRPSGAFGELVAPELRLRVLHALENDESAARGGDGCAARAALALDAAARTLRSAAAFGFGPPAGAELDLYVVDLGGLARGWAALEAAVPASRGASGFVVVDGSRQQSATDVVGMAALGVARLILAACDAEAPTFWLEPSALWLAQAAVGAAASAEPYEASRWNHPERGPVIDDPVLARGNVGLIAALGRPSDAGAALAACWRALATRAPTDDPAAVIEAALARAATPAAGPTLAELTLRAALLRIASGAAPARWAAQIGSLPHAEASVDLPIAPRGAAMLEAAPDPAHPEGVRVLISTPTPGWSPAVAARRRDGGWDAAPLLPERQRVEVAIPWSDYDRAVVLLVRPADAGGGDPVRVSAEPAPEATLELLEAFAVRPAGDAWIEVSWSSREEVGLFGWVVERAELPTGPWAAIPPTPIPAIDSGGADYAIRDRAPADGRQRFYRVVALTSAGLRITGPAASAAR